MLEIVLGIGLVTVSIGLLVFLLLHEQTEKQYIKEIQTLVINLPLELQKFYADMINKDNIRTQKSLDSIFNAYLKHIEKLEKLALPSPVTVKKVKQVLDRTGELADEPMWVQEENEIEKEKDKGIELQNDQWMGLINENTKVSFADEIPLNATVIE